jgi:hypothetical protein
MHKFEIELMDLKRVAGASDCAVFGHSSAEIVGSNPTEDMDVCLL